MAVTTQESTEYANLSASPPVIQNKQVLGGKVEIVMVTHDQSGVGDAGSSVAIARLPAGRVRLLGALSNLYINWTASSQTLDAGWDAYTDFSGAAVVADPDGLDDGLDVDTVGSFALGSVAAVLAVGSTKVFESQSGVVLRLTAVGALADGDDVAGFIAYIAD